MTTPAALATFLADNIPAIACDEAAGELFRDVRNAVDAIERAINRPIEPKYCGNCPAIIEDKQGQELECATALYVPWDHHTQQYPVEVECWRCKVSYSVDKLIQDALNSIAGLLYSAREVQELMAQIGQPIPPRTWRYWRAEEKIIVRGWRGAEPMYWINDVKDLMAQKPQKMATGSTAHRNAS